MKRLRTAIHLGCLLMGLAAVPAMAQEAASTASGAKTSRAEITTQLQSVQADNQKLTTLFNKFMACQQIGAFYAPAYPGVGSDGCTAPVARIIGTAECMVPEANPTFNGIAMPRNLNGQGKNCTYVCRKGTPVSMRMYTDTQGGSSFNENGGFCNNTNVNPSQPYQCHIENFVCVDL